MDSTNAYRHRGFTRKKFLDAVEPEYVGRYLARRGALPADEKELTPQRIDAIVQEQDAVTRKRINEEFQCINDVAEKGMDYLDRTCREFNEPFNDQWPPERLAMRLFAERPEAFQAAYDWYLCRTAATNMSYHQFVDAAPRFDAAMVESFRDEVQRYFSEQEKGRMCQVRYHKDDDAHLLLVARGDYMHTQSIWSDGDVSTNIVRPAKEDVLRFSTENSVLSVKIAGRSNSDRTQYVEAFGTRILGMSEVPSEAFESTTVSLEPIRTGNFDYWGNDQIEWIRLVAVELVFPEIKSTVRLSASDVTTTVHDHLTDLKLTNGTLKSAKLNFQLDYSGASSRPVPVELRPPRHTILNKKRDAEIIEAHLRENGVLLV